MTSSSKIGRSEVGSRTVDGAVDVEEVLRRWLDSDFDVLRDEGCFDRRLSLSSASFCRLPPLRPASRPASTARGPYPSRRYDLRGESDMMERVWERGVIDVFELEDKPMNSFLECCLLLQISPVILATLVMPNRSALQCSMLRLTRSWCSCSKPVEEHKRWKDL